MSIASGASGLHVTDVLADNGKASVVHIRWLEREAMLQLDPAEPNLIKQRLCLRLGVGPKGWRASMHFFGHDLAIDEHLIAIFCVCTLAYRVILIASETLQRCCVFLASRRLLPLPAERVTCLPDGHEGRRDNAARYEVGCEPFQALNGH